MFKCAIVGVSGSRARGHAEAYTHIPRGRLAAISTRQPDKLAEFGDKYGVAARYTDYRELFAVERPDLVHVNTPPDVRLEVFQAAEEAGVPALIVEKPLAIQWEDALAIRDFAARSRVKIAVNHQLHFQPRRQALQRLVADGQIGEVRFVDASSGLNMAYQGTHTLQAIGAFLPDARPRSIFAQIGGAEGLQENARRHYAPDRCLASIVYDSGASALLRCGANAPRVLADDSRVYAHKRVAVYGTAGFVNWTMWSWQVGRGGQVESGIHDYFDEDILGQAAMTEAMFDWIEDDRAVHPLNLERSLADFTLVLHAYESGLDRTVHDLAADEPSALPTPELVGLMRRRLY